MAPDGSDGPAGDFADRLRRETRTLHAEAERSGFVADLLRGRTDRPAYALYLRNLHAAYAALEAGLDGNRGRPAVAAVAHRAVARVPALAADLEALLPGWRRRPLLAAGERYAERLAGLAAAAPDGLVAHAYVRYLGDLNGGRVLRRLLAERLELAPGELAFHDFPEVADPEGFRAAYRAAFDLAGRHLADPDAVAAEAATAFRLNIALSLEVQAAAAG